MTKFLYWMGLNALLILLCSSGGHAADKSLMATEFLAQDRLKVNVDFWVGIYTKYLTSQGVIHDAKYVDHVYESFQFSSSTSVNYRMIHQAKVKWKEVLISLDRKERTHEPLTQEENRIFELFSDIHEPHKFLNAAHRKRLRFQLGQKDRFVDGLYQSGKYLPLMEDVFQKQGLPVQLTRLPFVESSFNIRARSKVGASGIWQFMPSTGRLFLKINAAIDERNDPIRATEAAAKLLQLNYESLKKWPLAVTAYNHGRKGMMRAVRKVGSDDLAELIEEYRTRSFGFASSNFFAELLAAIEVERNADQYFGVLARVNVAHFVEVPIPDYIAFSDLVEGLDLDSHAIKELNPALSEAVLQGKLLVPSGYLLRIPYALAAEGKDSFKKGLLVHYQEIPAFEKQKHQKPGIYDMKPQLLKDRGWKHRKKSVHT